MDMLPDGQVELADGTLVVRYEYTKWSRFHDTKAFRVLFDAFDSIGPDWRWSDAPTLDDIKELYALLKLEVEARPKLEQKPRGTAARPAWPGSGSKLWINIGKVRDVRTSAFLGLLANWYTHSAPVALTASIIASLWSNVRILDDDELEVLRALNRLIANKPQRQWAHSKREASWLDIDDIFEALPEEFGGKPLLDMLSTMTSRGILEEHVGRWTIVY